MQQVINVWNALSPRRRIIVVAATVAMFGAVLALSRMATTPSLTLLYAGLESGPAGEVVRALEQRGVAYDVRGGAIFVEARKRDELRMTLASEGLPANDSKGYELLDSLSGFGTTSQMFDATYWRAKEGELARTILASPGITAARVHIAGTGSNPFQRDMRPTASVSLRSSMGAVSPAQARALRYLVASAVAGMSPDDVAVIDGAGGLVSGAEEAAAPANGEDRAELLRSRVQRLLEARVGPGNAVVEVSVDTETESATIRERRFDPESRVAISTDSQETSAQSSNAGAGDVTVASNLPDGDAAGGDKSTSRNTETRERVNYEVSETESEIQRASGAVKRLTVAVLVNGQVAPDGAGGGTFEPRPQDELDGMKELVASAVGFDPARGDVITIKSMEFTPVAEMGTAGEMSLMDQMNFDLMSLVQIAILALVALVLGLFVVRPVLTRDPPAPLALPSGAGGRRDALPALTGEIDDGTYDLGEIEVVSDRRSDAQSLTDGSPSDPVERLRAMIGERQEDTVEILRSWLDEHEERV